jgi:hypothetical protein
MPGDIIDDHNLIGAGGVCLVEASVAPPPNKEYQ